MTDVKPAFLGQVSLGNILIVGTLLVSMGVNWGVITAQVNAERDARIIAVSTEREHRLALERRIDRGQSEQERRLSDGLRDIKETLGKIEARLDRVVDQRSTIGPQFPGGPR